MKVLISLDYSDDSRHVLEFARDWLAHRDAAVTLLHVIVEHIMYGRAGAVPAEVYNMPLERAHAQQLLEEAADSLRQAEAGTTFNTLLKTGAPEDVILEAATEVDADLIILGSRGLGAAGRLLLGSVSTHVVTHAHTAVLVVHPRVQAAKKTQ